MKALLAATFALLTLGSAAHAQTQNFTAYSALCEIDGRVVRLHGAACLSDTTARADLLEHAQKMGDSCRRTLGPLRARVFESDAQPRRADGCDLISR